MDVETRLADAQLRLAELEVLVADLTERVTRREARCARLAENGDGTDIVTTGDGGPQLNYIHADHLGRPAFVTDATGAILWDAGITTPFGVSIETQAIGDAVQTTAALTQPLMFPGQYRDAETGYDDNWHRTYDPALGRYLQSDPIGLSGGLNRYAYVGGNPVGAIDPMGLSAITFSDFAGVVGGEVRSKPLRGKNPAYIGGVIAGAGLATIYYNSIIYEDPAASDEVCEGEESEILSRTIPKPKKPKRGCTAICRADMDDRIIGNNVPGRPKFAFGEATAHSCQMAVKAAKRQATQNLGAQPKHIDCNTAGK